MHFLKGGFLFAPKLHPNYNSKVIGHRNLKLSPVGFGYKITPYTNFHQNQRCSG